jgi:uroporphyrinogen decarboxylase
MNSRERILAAINHQPLDRIPMDIWATEEVWSKLHKAFGTNEEIREKLHIDGFGSASPVYIGPALTGFPEGTDEQSKLFYGIWGMGLKWMDYGTGRYLEQANYPLAELNTIEELESYPWPSPDWFDYSNLHDTVKKLHDKQAIQIGYMAPFYRHNLLRGLESSLMDSLENPEYTHYLMDKVCEFEYEYHRRIFESCDGLIDVAQVTDDLGSQNGPLISMKVYKEFYAPRHKRFIDLCHEFGIKVFHHDDGSMRAFLPSLVEMGIDILNPVQWTCPNMDLLELKQEFGKKICFHGGVENQKILPFGSPEEVRNEVRHCIESLASDGTGYILAPCHNIQPVTPMENIIAMYDEAWKYKLS